MPRAWPGVKRGTTLRPWPWPPPCSGGTTEAIRHGVASTRSAMIVAHGQLGRAGQDRSADKGW
jgi:hypothetical protein